MGSILIVGNIVKDIYLKLDERQNVFEKDSNDTPWMNLGFDGSSHKFFRRTSVYGGAAVTLEVFNKFGINSEISGEKLKYENGELIENGQKTSDYRYVLCSGEKISYFVPSIRTHTKLSAPKDPVSWVFVDKSATITQKLIDELGTFLSISKDTKVAIYLSKDASEVARSLARKANLIFSEITPPDELRNRTFVIKNDTISINDYKLSWNLEKTEMLTHLTVHSIAAASIMGALFNGKNKQESMEIAKANVENASLAGTLSLKKLEEIIEKEKSEKINLDMMAKTLMTLKKGILAADESGGSIHKKFESMNITDDFDHRRDYRNIFFTTKDLEKYVSGIILFDETARQKADNGQNFVEFLTAKGIIPGIKVDQGLVDLPNSSEKYTKGLDGLDERLKEYYEMGLRFAKWRAAFEVTDATPTKYAVEKNCEILAKYALLCQKNNIVPIVEPEVVHDGDYSAKHCALVTGKILDVLFDKLKEYNVRLEACILKCNMVLAGKKFGKQSTPVEVGEMTAEVLKEHVPKELAGVVFLSGGQGVEQATDNLQAVTNYGPFPWPVTFSFARALQGPALEAWRGNNENADAARAAFYDRLVANTNALIKH
ncbi:fructose-bisphosphate aldolase class I [Candidatus Saccharibacteria bacterium]|nr:fructose-bisphosphate aldolase class I [Candidatus Saccharibacteria bacterium]